MILTCDGCKTRFRVPDEKISAEKTRVRCSRCGVVFTVRLVGDKVETVRAETGPAPRSATATPMRAATSGPPRGDTEPGSPWTPTGSQPRLETEPGTTWAVTGSSEPASPRRSASDPFSHLDLGKVPLGSGAGFGGRLDGMPGQPAAGSEPPGPPPLERELQQKAPGPPPLDEPPGPPPRERELRKKPPGPPSPGQELPRKPPAPLPDEEPPGPPPLDSGPAGRPSGPSAAHLPKATTAPPAMAPRGSSGPGPAAAKPSKTKPAEAAMLESPMVEGPGPDMSSAIDLGSEAGPSLELETFGATGSSGAAPPRPKEAERRSISPLSKPGDLGAASGQEGRMVAFAKESEGQPELGLDLTATKPEMRRRNMASAPPLGPRSGSQPIGMPLDRSRSIPAEALSSRVDTPFPRVVTTPPLVSQATPPQLLVPSLGVTALTSLTTMLLLLLLFVLVLLAKNGWVLDLRRPSHALAVAMGQEMPDLEVSAASARLTDLRQVLFPTSSGKSLFLVEGDVVNTGSRPLQDLMVHVRLVDAQTRRVLEARDVPGGCWLDPAQLLTVDGPKALDLAFQEAVRRSSPFQLEPGARAPFMAVFFQVSEDRTIRDLAIEARAIERSEAAGGGS